MKLERLNVVKITDDPARIAYFKSQGFKPVEDEGYEDDLEKMSHAELKALAAELEIEIPGNVSKAALIAAILERRSADNENDD